MRPEIIAKYRPYPPVKLADRQWPDRVIDHAPAWCSVDLRDGNQALIDPMGIDKKQRMFARLVEMGFKEIEVGFPAASDTEFSFLRHLVDRGMIPADVTVQVLTQARAPLIEKTFESLKGVRRAVVHLYNSTSELQRRVVFGLDRAGIIDIAVQGTRLVRQLADKAAAEGTEIVFQYSPESFTGTELDFAVEITEAVMAEWGPTPQRPAIVNLPATVEMSTSNIYADQIEWFGRQVKNRDSLILSVHPHNDRGCAVAAAEMALLAGADRVEGTLFGNGERTGNVDIVTLALNMVTQGVDPGLDITAIDQLVELSEYCTGLPVHPRHPYAGGLVYTAFSGSHQDAIRKGFAAMKSSNSGLWEVPYLPIDPADVGRTYEAVIRVNSQSGKGGVAYVLESDYGYELPRALLVEFAQVVQREADATGREMSSQRIRDLFETTYVAPGDGQGALRLVAHDLKRTGPSRVALKAMLEKAGGGVVEISGEGNGPIDAFVAALKGHGIAVTVADYHEHTLGRTADAEAMCYVQAQVNGKPSFGAGRDASIVEASLRAVLAAVVRV